MAFHSRCGSFEPMDRWVFKDWARFRSSSARHQWEHKRSIYSTASKSRHQSSLGRKEGSCCMHSALESEPSTSPSKPHPHPPSSGPYAAYPAPPSPAAPRPPSHPATACLIQGPGSGCRSGKQWGMRPPKRRHLCQREELESGCLRGALGHLGAAVWSVTPRYSAAWRGPMTRRQIL